MESTWIHVYLFTKFLYVGTKYIYMYVLVMLKPTTCNLDVEL